MNKTAIVLGLFGIIAVSIAGAVLIAILRPDASASFIAFIGTTLTVAIGAVATIGAVSTTLKRIEKQTNGTNTALLAATTGIPTEVITAMKTAPVLPLPIPDGPAMGTPTLP